MKQFSRTALAGIVVLTGIAFVGGCQRSGSTDTTARSDSSMRGDTSRRGDADMTTGRFDQAYEATRDTEWVSSTAADAERGTLMRGDRVMFSQPPMNAEWQEARTTTGRTVYVRPGDFRRAS